MVLLVCRGLYLIGLVIPALLCGFHLIVFLLCMP